MKRSIFKRIALFAAVLMAAYFFSSCSTRKVVKSHYNEYKSLNRGDFATDCDFEFPINTISVVELPSVTKTDTILIAGEVISCPEPKKDENGNYKPEQVECPPSKIINNSTIGGGQKITVESMSKIYSLNQKIKDQDEQIKDLENKAKYKVYFYLLLILIAAYVVIRR